MKSILHSIGNQAYLNLHLVRLCLWDSPDKIMIVPRLSMYLRLKSQSGHQSWTDMLSYLFPPPFHLSQPLVLRTQVTHPNIKHSQHVSRGSVPGHTDGPPVFRSGNTGPHGECVSPHELCKVTGRVVESFRCEIKILQLGVPEFSGSAARQFFPCDAMKERVSWIPKIYCFQKIALEKQKSPGQKTSVK